MKYTIKEQITLFELLGRLFAGSSKNTMRQWVKEGRILLDGKKVKDAQAILSPGQTLVLSEKVKYLEEEMRILYEDRDLVVVEKPYGLLSVASLTEKGETAHAVLKRYYSPRKVHVVHRLDQDTSGVMVFALSEKGREGLKELFASHQIVREYTAIVEGRLKEQQGTWKSYLHEDKAYRVHSSPSPSFGQVAITHYFVEVATRAYSRLRLTLETGRKNQIRVHCQVAGHSVVGDKKYGARSNKIKRLALHAHRLEFMHPVSLKMLSFYSPAPEEFDRLAEIR